MAKMSEERKARYAALDKPFMDMKDKELEAWVREAMDNGVALSAVHSDSRKHTGYFQAPTVEDAAGLDIAFIGIPWEYTAYGTGGTKHGPGALRKYSNYNYGFVHDVTGNAPMMQCKVGDFGDVLFSKSDIDTRLVDIEKKFDEAAAAGAYTIGIGGEHTSTYSILKALSRHHDDEAFGMIHIDAHGDTMAGYGGDKINDGSCFRYGIIEGAIDPERTVSIGIRNSYSKMLWEFSNDAGITTITGQEVHEKGTQYIIDMTREIIGTEKAYFTFDSDGLCASSMMGTTNPELFGLTHFQARDLILGCRGLDIVGADYMELNPLRDPTGYSTLVSTVMVWELMCLLADAREAKMGRKNPTSWS